MNYFSFWDNILCFSILPAPVCLEAFQLDLWWSPNTDVDIYVLLGSSSAPSLLRIIIIETCKCLQSITLTVSPIAEKALPLPDPPPLVEKLLRVWVLRLQSAWTRIITTASTWIQIHILDLHIYGTFSCKGCGLSCGVFHPQLASTAV